MICLLSALGVHGIGTQLPAEVWVAIERRARVPLLTHPPLRVVRFGGRAFTHGVETHRFEGESVRVYGVAKTLADLKSSCCSRSSDLGVSRVPGSPDPRSAAVSYVTGDRIQPVNAKFKAVVKICKNLGRGSTEMLSGQRAVE